MTEQTIIEEVEPKDKSEKMLGYAERIALGESGNSFIYCIQEDKFYIYNSGVWEQIFKEKFLYLISKSFPKINKYRISERKQILDNYKIIKNISLNDFNKSSLINFKNCMFDPIGMNVLSHDEKYFSTSRIPYKYDQLAQCPLWNKTLLEILEGDEQKISLLQEFFGYCLIPDTRQKKALLLLGESNCGKSTILFILRAMMGEANASSVPLKYLSNPQYTPMLINKLVNIDADVSKNAQDYEAEFKIITSGEPVHCNQKFVSAFDFIPICRIVLAANIFPKITDHSSAFYNRLILIPCNRIFTEQEQDRELVSKLYEELPGIFNWSCKGLIRLKKRGMFEQHDFMKEAVQELEDDNNPSNVFFREHIEVKMNAYIEKGELFDKYKAWSEKNKQYTLSSAMFSNSVYKNFHKQTPKKAHLQDGRRIWRNLVYIENKQAPKPQEIQWQD